MSTTSTVVDLAPILTPALQVFGEVLASLITAACIWAVNELRKKNVLHATDQQVDALRGSIQTSAGIALSNLATGIMPMKSVQISNQTMRDLAIRALAAVPDSAAALGVTEATATQMLVGAIGHAIAGDPTLPTVAVKTESGTTTLGADGKVVAEASSSTTTAAAKT